MKYSRTSIVFCLALLTLLITLTGSVFAVKEYMNAQIVTPVSGSLAIAVSQGNDDEVIVVDTQSGQIRSVVQDQGALSNPLWDNQGKRLVYNSSAFHVAILDLETGIANRLHEFGGYDFDNPFYPLGWSSDNQNILYLTVEIGWPELTFTVYLVDVDSKDLSALWTIETPSILTEVTPPSGAKAVAVYRVNAMTRNPVYDNWVVVQLEGFDSELLEEPNHLPDHNPYPTAYVNTLWNYQSGQMVNLDGLVSGKISSEGIAWSKYGDKLLIDSYDFPRSETYISFLAFSPNGTISVLESATRQDTAETWLGVSWLDVGDLLFTQLVDGTSDPYTFVYNIAEIIDGQWYETEFMKIVGRDFKNFEGFDWYIRATEAEKRTLTCIFDQTLTSRLELGEDGRVAVNDGTPRELRSEPGTDKDIIAQISEGTQFDVIGEPWCANGYRWWQIQLADDTIGYAAEADKAVYFLENVD